MSEASNAIGQSFRPSHQEQCVIDAESTIQSYFEALEDADCRDILDTTTHESLSASQISERLDLPLSTTYRKLELLTEPGLLDESVRIRKSGKHTSEFTRGIGEVTVSIEAHRGTVLRVTAHEPSIEAAAD